MNSILGKKVAFTPTIVDSGSTTKVDYVRPVKGVVKYVNERHRYFTAEYYINGVAVRESFKFHDIGKDVMFCE